MWFCHVLLNSKIAPDGFQSKVPLNYVITFPCQFCWVFGNNFKLNYVFDTISFYIILDRMDSTASFCDLTIKIIVIYSFCIDFFKLIFGQLRKKVDKSLKSKCLTRTNKKKRHTKWTYNYFKSSRHITCIFIIKVHVVWLVFI